MMAVITVVKLSRGGLDSPSTDSEVSVWKKGRMRIVIYTPLVAFNFLLNADGSISALKTLLHAWEGFLPRLYRRIWDPD